MTSIFQFLKRSLPLAVLAFACGTCLAQTPYKGIQPGTSTKVQTERILGQPVNQVSETMVEYGPQPGVQKIYVQYRQGAAVVERIVALLASPGSRSTLMATLDLPARPTEQRVNDKGRREEYFGPPKLVVLIYEGIEDSSDVSRVEYYSPELFEVAAKDLKNSDRPADRASASENNSAEGKSSDDRVTGRPRTVPPPSQTAARDIPDEVGVYVKVQGGLVEVQPELVTWRDGNALGAILGGLSQEPVNGMVKKPHSQLRIRAPVEFIIRCPEGVSVSEYQLLKLDEKDDRREFRTMTSGFFPSGKAGKNAIEFAFEKIAPNTFRIVLTKLKSGEYGFLPPGETKTAIINNKSSNFSRQMFSDAQIARRPRIDKSGGFNIAPRIYTFEIE